MRRFIEIFLLLVALTAIIYLAFSSQKFFESPLAFRDLKAWWRGSVEDNLLILYGNVDIRQVDLGFRVSGRVQSMFFEEGTFVPLGERMAILDRQPYEDQVKGAAARIESSQASLTNAISLVDRRRQLLGTGGISVQDIDDAISSSRVLAATLKETEAALGVAQTNLNDTELFSPSDGLILTRIREPGTVVREADPIYTLSLLSPVWVRTYVSEGQLGLIYPNMPVEVYTDTPGGHVYQGHIGFISPVAEFTPKTVETAQLRTDLVYRLRAIVDNPDLALRQGMPVTVKIHYRLSEAPQFPVSVRTQ